MWCLGGWSGLHQSQGRCFVPRLFLNDRQIVASMEPKLWKGRLLLPDRPQSVGRLVDKQNTNRTVQNGARSQTVSFATSLKRCSPLIPMKSRHFDKCCKHLKASTNCLGEHRCQKRQFLNCTVWRRHTEGLGLLFLVVCNLSAIFANRDWESFFIYCFWLFCLFILDI